MEHLSNDHKDCLNQHENSHKLWDETGYPVVNFDGKSMETEATAWSEIPNGGKAMVEQIPVSEEIKNPKREGLWESQSGIWVGKLTIWVRSFEIEKL